MGLDTTVGAQEGRGLPQRVVQIRLKHQRRAGQTWQIAGGQGEHPAGVATIDRANGDVRPRGGGHDGSSRRYAGHSESGDITAPPARVPEDHPESAALRAPVRPRLRIGDNS